jgi:hypothetical protein
VVYFFNPSTQEAEAGGYKFEASLGNIAVDNSVSNNKTNQNKTY